MPATKLTGLTELSALALTDLTYAVDVSDTTDDPAGSSRKLTVERLGGFLHPKICDGRLTLESAVPISVTDQTIKGVIYFTPYRGNRICLYDGTRWKLYTFTERSLTLTATSGKNHDVFLYDNAGTLTIELSAAWTNDLSRADALTTQDGVEVKSGATTRRWLGTIRASASNQCEDSTDKRYVWNAYNRVPRTLRITDGTDSWTYATAAWRAANNAVNSCEYVVGASEDPVWAQAVGCYADANGDAGACGIGIDSSTVNSAITFHDAVNGGISTVSIPLIAQYEGWPGLGYHALHWLEYARSGTVTFRGDGGFANLQAGLIARVWG